MVIPSIDLMGGKVVQLKQGRDKVLEQDNPLELADEFNAVGQIAVIDLDAALGVGDNSDLIQKLCQRAECRVGGGIRSIDRAKDMLAHGAAKVIIGTTAFQDDRTNHEFLKELAATVGRDRVILAIDALNHEIVTRGWRHPTGLHVFDTVKEVELYCTEFLFTCVEKEGGMQGTDMDAIARLRKLTSNRITAAGGISTLEEIRQLADLDVDVQLGMALYTGKIRLVDAVIESLNWKQGLIPVITQDTSGQVLMLAFVNKEALNKTFETGNVWYFSRSRESLWMKGETSGNSQKFRKLRVDCDRDSLLITAEQTNVACHTGSYSCFGEKQFSLHELYEVVQDRLINPKPGSYTAKLKSDALLTEKILEEAQELVEAEEREHVIWEAADVLYFVTVLLARKNIPFADVLHELKRRRKK